MELKNENKLALAIQKGDKNAERKLYEHYYQRILLILGPKVRSVEDRKELVQNILFDVLVQLRNGKYRADRNTRLSSYIYGILTNQVRQYYRKEKLKHKYETPMHTDDMVHLMIDEQRPDSRIERMEQHKAWDELLNSLKPKYREVIYRRYFLEEPIKTIAVALGLEPQKVSDYLKYARTLLLREIKFHRFFSIFLPLLTSTI